MAEKTIPVRTALMPAYYKAFRCVMEACQDNCCDDGWKIEFSKRDYLTLKEAVRSDELKARMAQSLRRLRDRGHDGMYAEFCLSEAGRCAFHTPEGLCRLQMECGAEALPYVCRSYPRKKTYTSAALEYSLSPSCEGVLALLWDLPEGIDFLEEPLPKQEWKDAVPANPAEVRFAGIRALWIDALQARPLPLEKRLTLLGLLTQQLRDLDWSDGEGLDRWLERSGALLQDPAALSGALEKLSANQQMFLSCHLQTLLHLGGALKKEVAGELLRPITGQSAPENLDPNRLTINAGRYETLAGQLEELLGHSDYFLENLMVDIAFYLGTPSLKSPEELWKSYVNLCSLYGFYRFAAVCAMDREVSRERLFHVLVHVSRSLIHNIVQRTRLRDEFFQNDSATLAHMAILVGG